MTIGGLASSVISTVAPAVAPVPADCLNSFVTYLGPSGTTGADAPYSLSAGDGDDAGEVVAVTSSSVSPRTAGGVGVGSDADSVQAEFPSAVRSTRGAFIDQLVVKGDPGWITFQLTGSGYTGTVDLVSVVQGGEPPAEYCG